MPSEEIKERNKCICLVVKGLSSWLIKSTLVPKSGSSLNSLYEQVSRNKVPQFLNSQLGRQYSDVKRIVESFSRHNNFTKKTSISINNNANLLHMLDPIVIDEIDRNRKRFAAAYQNPGIDTVCSHRPPLDFTQPQPTADALANLVQVSMNLSMRDHNLPFSTNIERMMLANLPHCSDSYFHFGQISLEGFLKFLGIWNKNNRFSNKKQQNQQQQALPTPSSLAASISNFVSGTSTSQMGSINNPLTGNIK